MTKFETGWGGTRAIHLIPEAWTVFVYRGFIYERQADGRFVCVGSVKPQAKKTA